jgi:hypothetical protein
MKVRSEGERANKKQHHHESDTMIELQCRFDAALADEEGRQSGDVELLGATLFELGKQHVNSEENNDDWTRTLPLAVFRSPVSRFPPYASRLRVRMMSSTGGIPMPGWLSRMAR